ncbi:MAG: hypothetical protein EBZ13_09860 [Planctomycetia bacterium]|nr:hypothetical protein [Planctomycetia bacterium]
MNVNEGRSTENGLPRPILIGYRATGKSTLAADLARRIGCRQIDADEAFETAWGCSIASFIGDRGEIAFRDAETALLRDLLGQPDAILATGGGEADQCRGDVHCFPPPSDRSPVPEGRHASSQRQTDATRTFLSTPVVSNIASATSRYHRSR